MSSLGDPMIETKVFDHLEKRRLLRLKSNWGTSRMERRVLLKESSGVEGARNWPRWSIGIC